LRNQEIYEIITELLKQNENPEIIKSRLQEIHPYDFAEVFPDLTQEERKIIYSLFSSDELAILFSYLDEEDSAFYLGELKAEKSAAILENMDADDATDILQELKSDEQKEYQYADKAYI
jgi:magnesium transporter